MSVTEIDLFSRLEKYLESNEKQLLLVVEQLLDKISDITSINSSNITLKLIENKENVIEIQAGKIFFVFQYDEESGKVNKSVKEINSSIKTNLNCLLTINFLKRGVVLDISDILDLLDIEIKKTVNCKNSLKIWQIFANNTKY